MVVARILRRLWRLLTLQRRDAELEDELHFHLEMEARLLERGGLPADAARRQAAHRFGDLARHRDDARDARGTGAAEDFVNDVRIGFRTLRRQPVFTTVAALTLAIGIGGTTAVFGAVYGVLLAPLPYADADRIVTLWERDTRGGDERGEVSPGNFLDWRERARSFDGVAAAEPWSVDYVGPDGPERFEAALVTEGYFDILRVNTLLGRTFRPEESGDSASRVVVLSERIWRTRFGGDSTLVGRTLVLDSVPMLVIGVLPRAVEIPFSPDAWLPKVYRGDEREDRRSAFWTVIARLAPHARLDGAAAEMHALAGRIASERPSTNERTGASVVPLHDALTGTARTGLWILFGAVALVLVVACANVASLQLAQATRRSRELAVRTAIGAGSARIVRQLFAENLVLAVLGGLGGVFVAYWGIAGIRALAPVDLPRVELLGLTPTVLSFAIAASVIAAIAFGLAPALGVRRLQVTQALSGGGRSTTLARGTRRLTSALVAGQVALALVLFIGAGLLVRSFTALLSVDRGFDSNGVLVTTLQTWSYYPTQPLRIEYARASTARLSALPGVVTAGMASSLPMTVPIGQERSGYLVEGEPAPAPGDVPVAHATAVTPGYFGVLRMRLREGRLLNDGDREGTTPVVVVNETFARRHWPSGSAVGQRIRFSFQGPPGAREIVGVVGDVRQDGLAADPRPSVYIPHAQGPTGAMHLLVRTTGDPRAMEPAVRRELIAMNGVMPLSDVTTLDASVAGSLRERRFQLALITAFAGAALVLALIGVYGLISHTTAARTKEIGVRVAVGATSAGVIGLVLRQGAVLAGTGVALGVAGAIATTRLLRGMLYDVTPLDGTTFVVGVATLLTASVAACLAPACRAAATDPVKVLRQD
jgi:predicted permease